MGFLIVLNSYFATLVYASEPDDRVEKIKAAMVLNIARFVSWPASALSDQSRHLSVCYYNQMPFGTALGTIQEKTVKGKELLFRSIATLSESNNCHLLLLTPETVQQFIAEGGAGSIQPVLTIADFTTDRPSKGAMINLIRAGSRIGFEIDLGKSRGAGLRMSSELLKHARLIGEEG